MSFDLPIALNAHFDVLQETEDYLLVNKAAPLLTHPTGTKNEPTLLHGLQQLLAYELACGGQISLINRLDRETSGIVLVAKTAEAASELGKAMQARQMHKESLAIVTGHPMWQIACCAGAWRKWLPRASMYANAAIPTASPAARNSAFCAVCPPAGLYRPFPCCIAYRIPGACTRSVPTSPT